MNESQASNAQQATGQADTEATDFKASHVARDWKHSAPLLGCRFDPTGRYVFATSMDNTIQRWDLAEDQHATFAGHQSWLRSIGFSTDGATMYSAGYDGKLCFWPATAQQEGDAPIQPTREIEAHAGWIRWLAVHPDGEIVATAGNDLGINLWSAKSGELVRSLAGHQKHIYSLLFHPAGEWLLSGDLTGVIHQWEIASGSLVRSFDAKPLHTYHGGQQVDYGGVRCMTLSCDGQQLACGGLHKATNPFAGVQEPLVLVLDWETGKQVRTHETTEIPRGIVWRLVYELDGTLIGGVGGDVGFIVFWNNEQTEFHKLRIPSPVLDLDRHPRSPQLAIASHDGRIRIVRMTPKA